MYLLLQVNQEMIVVNKKNQNRTINLKDFYEVKGLLSSTNYPKFSTCNGQEAIGIGALFEWKKDRGVITGPKNKTFQIKNINKIFEKNKDFTNFTILRKWDYDYKKCSTKFENPCPYYHAAFASLMMPTALALISFLIMTSCTCCSMQGM